MYQLIQQFDSAPSGKLPIPEGTQDGFTYFMLNQDQKFGPTLYVLKFAPGSHIPAHYHKKATETFYLLEGEFIDNGVSYEPGTYFACEPNTVHGPHSTTKGCKLLVFQSQAVDATDFFIAREAVAGE